MHQSPFSPFTQFSYRVRMYSGCHVNCRPRSISAARNSIVLMNHWRLVTISSGLSPFSKNLTLCMMGRGSPISAPGAQQLHDARARLGDELPASSS